MTISEQVRYSMLIEWSEEDQVFLVSLPEWADHVLGRATHGATYEDAITHGRAALDALIASAHRHGEPLPAPRATRPASGII